MLADAEARQQALDPRRSFIVQAPAGSGKTELLTQRFLHLLGTVHQPEQVVALTFTRKAANEMRARITQALLTATAEDPLAAPHKQLTDGFARAALARSEQQGWQLLTNPSRLRITTIDSLCHSLAQAIPLYEQHTPYANVNTAPNELYLAAAQACFQYLLDTPTQHPTLSCLLEHLDNRQDHLIQLFIEQLRSRDQWLHIIYQAKSQDKQRYQYALSTIIQHEINCFKATIPAECLAPLLTLCRQVANLAPDGSAYQALKDWSNWDQLDGQQTQALGALLLTSQGTLRKSFDHHVGVKREYCNSAHEYQQLKADSKELLATLQTLRDFLPALQHVHQLPPPHYANEQWQVLQALLNVLPLLAAHLQLLFNQHNQVDFIAVAQQAGLALGQSEAPTDLALYLDYNIHHLLIDEFQDTSIHQFALISQLVAGFSPESNKTLFVVGDPMQSIYRFRGAEVGLFLRAKQQGIGPLQLHFLALTCNFRASIPLVDWINHQFRSIFPARDDLKSGAIAFHAATGVKLGSPHLAVTACSYGSREQQATGLVALIRSQLASYPEQSMALLIRSRSQLKPIIRALRHHQIAYQGTDIDWMASLPHIRDVWTLTQALLMPANRLAWLSFLRSPWCGIMLTDLHALAQINRKQSIVYALTQLSAHVQHFTEEGYARLRYVGNVLINALSMRLQQPLTEWLISTLDQLHQAAILTPRARDELEQYWQLIEQFEQDGQLSNLNRFKQALDSLYSQASTRANLHILTIHKAKGLEFDCVFLPSLSARPNGQSQPLLRWLTLPTEQDDPLLLLSPIHASANQPNALYDYLGRLDNTKDSYEQQRLFYVAVTRAKHRLFLCDFCETPARNSLRALLVDQPFTAVENSEDVDVINPQLPVLTALPSTFYCTPPPLLCATSTSNRSLLFSLHDPMPRLLGLVTHELLQWICTYHPAELRDVPVALMNNLMQQHSIAPSLQAAAKQRLFEFITPLFTQPRGQWLIAAHAEEYNEYELLMLQQGEIRTQIIDRTFMDQGKRWIIDFKTGREDEASSTQHRIQLNAYADSFAQMSQAPIHCGLYYLPTQHWVEWQHVSHLTKEPA